MGVPNLKRIRVRHAVRKACVRRAAVDLDAVETGHVNPQFLDLAMKAEPISATEETHVAEINQ
jgi:hypothetical protein